MTASSAPGARPGAEQAGPDHSVLRFLPALTLIAVVTVTSTSEWTLARTVLDLPPAVAWAVPVAIDSYVIAALRTRRDVLPAVLVMAGALASAMGAHLAAATRPDGTLPAQVTAPAAAVILSVLVIVAWRVHVLIDHLTGHHPAHCASAAIPADGQTMSTPVPAAAVPAAPVPAVDRPASTHGPGGGVAAAPLRPALATASTASASSVPVEAGTSRTGLDDEQILADLQTRGDGTSPGIRALKRTYAIGQSRAARIHQQIHQQTTDQPNRDTKKEQQNSTTKNQTEQQQESDSASNQDDDEPIQKSHSQECTGIDQEQTHKGITDRVGRPRSTEECTAPPFPALFRAGGEA